MKEDKREHKIHSHFGMGEYYKYFQETYGRDIDRQTFKSIIEDYHLGLRKLIINESLIYQMPYVGMEIMIKKDRRRPKIVDGKVVNNAPPDWKATNELWERNPEAAEKKIIVRLNNSHTSGYVYRVYLKKFKCNIKNRSLYKINTNRAFQHEIRDALRKNHDLDAYLLY